MISMVASMTGFGRGEAESGGYTAVAELRSVNNRYCEVSTRLPRTLNERDSNLQRLIKDVFARGRISLGIQVTEPRPDAAPVRLDAAAVRGYRTILQELQELTESTDNIRLDHYLQFSDIFVDAEPASAEEDHLWLAAREAVSIACDAMNTMRLQEGEALSRELIERLDGIQEKLETVEQLAPERVPSAQSRLRERLADILEDGRIDSDRLEFEMAMLADKLDVREECVRLRSHLDLFRKALELDEPIGRKLNFLSQEMNREINTIGSKSNDADMSHLVVGMKEELEKIREQVENVE